MKGSKAVKESRNLASHYDSGNSTNSTSSLISTQLLGKLTNIEKEEVEHMNRYYNDRIQIQKEAIDKWYTLQSDIHTSWKHYKSETYVPEKQKADDNVDNLISNLQSETLFKKDYSFDIEKKLGIDHSKLASYSWFDSFKKSQILKFLNNLHVISKKMVEIRLPGTVQERRKTLVSSIDNLCKAIDKSSTSEGVDPYIKHNLSDLFKLINELQTIDNIVPQIIKDLSDKPEEFSRELVPIIEEFINKLELLNKDIEQNLFSDSSNKILYDKIERDEPSKIWASHYDIEITSAMLVSLRPAKYLHPSVVAFYLRYLQEKTAVANKTLADGDKVYIANELIDLYGGEDVLYMELGKEKNYRQTCKRLGFLFHVDLSHFVFVELYDTQGKGKYELVIYDSNMKEYENTHSRLKALFTEIVGEDELTNKTATKFGVGMDKTATKFGGGERYSSGGPGVRVGGSVGAGGTGYGRTLNTRVANCPQQMYAHDSAVFALKNASLLADNRKIIQGTYSQNEINVFRYEIFNMIVKCGRKDDVNFAFRSSQRNRMVMTFS